MNGAYPVTFSIGYPDRDLDRLTTGFRIFPAIPIAILLGSIGGYSARWATAPLGWQRSRSAAPDCCSHRPY
jgi:hypothetical protein